jgi:CRISPR-associated protein Cas2
MWIFAMFDVPVDTRKARRDHKVFLKNLLEDEFSMLQRSVYVRHCASEESAAVHYNRVKDFLPSDGEVRLITITDQQFQQMEIFKGGDINQPSASDLRDALDSIRPNVDGPFQV